MKPTKSLGLYVTIDVGVEMGRQDNLQREWLAVWIERQWVDDGSIDVMSCKQCQEHGVGGR